MLKRLSHKSLEMMMMKKMLAPRAFFAAGRRHAVLVTGSTWQGHGRRREEVLFLLPAAALAAVACWSSSSSSVVKCEEEEEEDDDDESELVVNWSATHSCSPVKIYSPETTAEAANIVREHHERREPLRPCGSTLSPNGMGFCRETPAPGSLLNMGLCDRILEIDTKNQLVTVECGARVDQVLEALAKENLTLENLASIAQQQIGGFIQIGAHGTGATLPPVDGQVVGFKIATPAYGVVEMRRGEHPTFDLALVGLGCMGVLLEATLRCVPKHLLRERTTVLTRSEAKKQCDFILKNNRHARFMWIPHVDCVVCITNNPTFFNELGSGQGEPPKFSMDERLEPMRKLLEECLANQRSEQKKVRVRRASMIQQLGLSSPEPHAPSSSSLDLSSLNFAQLRDELLKIDPLSLSHVKRVNRAEADFWRRSEGVDVADSSLKLNFECGGQQWVNECAFSAGTLQKPTGSDMHFMLDLLAIIEAEGIPAPAPIEQRWTAASTAKMSPAHSPAKDDLFSWVGIIMYLPTDDPVQRQNIAEAFDHYKRRCEHLLWPRYKAVEHWAKIEIPQDDDHAWKIRERLASRFPIADFAVARRYLDPYSILTNDLLDAVLPGLEPDDDDDPESYSYYASEGAWPVFTVENDAP